MTENSQNDTDISKDTRRRVKLYVLNDKRSWDDRGTGFVTCDFSDHHNGMSLFVQSEGDGSALLDTKIQFDTAYQKQQETLIVWSEGDNYELALSFQEKAGCEDIWEKICQVQGKDPSVEVTQETSYENESDSENGEVSGVASPSSGSQVVLPPVELSKLTDINNLFRNWVNSPQRREHLALAIENETYIKKLLDIFRMCEDLENIEYLQLIYHIFRSIFMLNKNALFEILFADENLQSVIGVLEYDPESTIEDRKRHRDFLWKHASYKEVIPFSSPELQAKIHQTYRAQYIQEVIFPAPSVFEENLLSTLNSFIFFNKVEIVSCIQDDEMFLRQLFAQLSNEQTSPERRQELILFLKEFCTFSQTLQPQSRETFFRTVSSYGILSAIEMCLVADERPTRSAAVDILSSVIEFNPSMARDYIISQATTQTDDDALLLNILIEQMFCDKDPELGTAGQLMTIIRLLIDPENMIGASQNKTTEKTEFLSFFYKRSMAKLCAPLLANTTGDKPGKNDYHTAHLLSLVLELLTFCAEHHTYHSRTYILSKDILPRALVLLQSKHSFLALSALRFLRRIIQLRDDCYNKAVVNKRLFAPIVRCFKENGRRYNLLNSAILELFEYIRTEQIKVLCAHFTENYIDEFKDVDYVKTFKVMKTRFDPISSTPVIGPANRPEGPPSGNNRFRRDARQMDETEETYFNEDDEEEWEDDFAAAAPRTSNTAPATPPTPPYSPVGDRSDTPPLRPAAASTNLEDDFLAVSRILDSKRVAGKGKEDHRICILLGKKSTSPTPPARTASPESTDKGSPVLVAHGKSLVDYDVEDSDEEEDESSSKSAADSKKDGGTGSPTVSPGKKAESSGDSPKAEPSKDESSRLPSLADAESSSRDSPAKAEPPSKDALARVVEYESPTKDDSSKPASASPPKAEPHDESQDDSSGDSPLRTLKRSFSEDASLAADKRPKLD